MSRTLANAYQCPQCGSIDVTIRSFGMPTQSFWQYMQAYDDLSRAITLDAVWLDDDLDFEGNLFDEDDFAAWFCPEEGRGFYAPGNHYDHGGCMVIEFEPSEGPCTCRACGLNFADRTSDDELDEDFDEEDDLFEVAPADNATEA